MMKFKKHNWMEYGRRGDVIEMTIKDSSGGKMDFFRCDNGGDYIKILRIIKSKYGFDFKPEVEKEESINEMRE